MIINRLNYEVFLIDYLDGKLSSSLVDELLVFLNQNPDIKNDFDGIQDTVLVAENNVFPDKTALKKKSFLKNGIDNEFEYLCIASIEGVLTQSENNSFQKLIKDDQLKQNQFSTYQKLKISPEASIVFTQKNRLKRTPIIPIRYSNLRLTISAAASIALLIGIYTIGRIIVNENPLEAYSNANIVASNTPTDKKITEKPTSKNDFVYKEEKNTPPVKRIINEEAPIEKEEERVMINIEESIPNELQRIDLTLVSIPKNHEEEIAKLAAKYSAKSQIPFDELYAQQESNNSTKELGVFDAIQYGVRSVGKLFGRDLKLDASKDDKGKIKKIIFESQLVAFSAPVNNNE